jgi:hypothetical protein
MDERRPLADPARVEMAQQLFPYHQFSAERYAALYAHTMGCSSFDQYRYPDPEFGAWIDKLHDILRSATMLEQCRREHLSNEEYAKVQAEIADADDGL